MSRDVVRAGCSENIGDGKMTEMVFVPSRASFYRVRVRSQDSAYVYFIMEAQEGLMSYRTLDHQAGDHYRDLEILVPAGSEAEALHLLECLPDILYLSKVMPS